MSLQCHKFVLILLNTKVCLSVLLQIRKNSCKFQWLSTNAQDALFFNYVTD